MQPATTPNPMQLPTSLPTPPPANPQPVQPRQMQNLRCLSNPGLVILQHCHMDPMAILQQAATACHFCPAATHVLPDCASLQASLLCCLFGQACHVSSGGGEAHANLNAPYPSLSSLACMLADSNIWACQASCAASGLGAGCSHRKSTQAAEARLWCQGSCSSSVLHRQPCACSCQDAARPQAGSAIASQD